VTPFEVATTPGESKKLRKKAGSSAQSTFWVAPARTSAFAAALLSGDPACERAALVVEETSHVLYNVGPLIARPPERSLPRDTTIAATGREASASLLAAALSDYVDFWFVPSPGGFVLYADNDEYATVLAPRQGSVSKAVDRLLATGFAEVVDYERRW